MTASHGPSGRHWYRVQPYPSQITLIATALAFQGKPTAFLSNSGITWNSFTFLTTHLMTPGYKWNLCFLWGNQKGIYSQRDQSFCRQLGRGQVSLTQVNLEGAWNLIKESKPSQLQAFKGWMQNLRNKVSRGGQNTILASLSHQDLRDKLCLLGSFKLVYDFN